MAWLGEGLTSLKGQLTSLAKGVLSPDQLQQGEGESSTNKSVKSQEISAGSSSPAPSTSSITSHSSAGLNVSATWNEALQSSDKFLGQDGQDWSGGGTPAVLQSAAGEDEPTTGLSQVEKDVASLIPRGIANFFHINTNETSGPTKSQQQATTSSAGKSGRNEGSWSDSGAGASISSSESVSLPSISSLGSSKTPAGGGGGGTTPATQQPEDPQLKTLQEANRSLTQQNASLMAEVASLSRRVQDLESQVAVSQDENANLSTGLEELDIQHQQAIEQILVVKDETQKQYEILKTEYKELRDSYDEIVKSKDKLKHISPLPSITEEEYEASSSELRNASVDKLLNELRQRDEELEAVEGENASLRSTVKELTAQLDKFNESLPPIQEGGEELEALETRVQSLEQDNRILREMRTNLEAEIQAARTTMHQMKTALANSEAVAKNMTNLRTESDRRNEEIIRRLTSENSRLSEAEREAKRLEQRSAELETSLAESYRRNRDLEKTCRELSEGTSDETTTEELNRRLEESEDRLKKSEEESEGLRSKLADLEDRFREVSGENAVLKGVENELRAKQEELEASKASLEDRLENARLQTSRAEENCEKLRGENSRLERESSLESESLRARIDRLESENCAKEELETENSELTRKLTQVKTELNRLDLELATSQQESAAKDRKMCEILLESTALEEEFKSYRETHESKYQALNLQYSQLKDELKALGEEAKNEREIQDLTQKNLKLEQDRASLESENRDLKEKLKSLEAEADYEKLSETENSLRLKIRDLETHLEALDNVLQENEISKDIFRQKEIEFKNQIQSKDEELTKYASALRERENSARESERKIAEISEELERLKESEKSMVESIKSYEIQTEALKENLREIARELDENGTRLDDALRSNSEMTIEIERLNAEKETRALEKTRIEEEYRQECEKTRREVEQLTASNVDLVRQHSRAVCERDSALERVKTLEEKLISLTDQLNSLSREKGAVSAQMAQAETSLNALQAHNTQLETTLQMKEAELADHRDQIERLNTLLTAEREKLEKFVVEKVEFNNRYEQLSQQLNEKSLRLESVEAQSDRQVGMLKQEVESLRNQLEYASQLLRVVDRQEAEGQSDANGQQKTCPNGCAQTQEELSRLSGNLINEQTTNKLLRNQVDELAEKYSKAEAKLSTLKQHLVEVEENYSGELTTARDKINDLQSKLAQTDERLRSSSTAYTSASIRANQQVESLTLQVKSVTEQKERLENELSKAEDNLQRHIAGLTNLQAVLHQFQRDKQKDIDFETERIRQTLAESNNRNKELGLEIKQLTEQLNEAKKGLGAATRLSEQLDKKSETISTLKKQVNELMDKLKHEEEKAAAAHSNIEGKVDRCLVKNLVVGYLTAPPKNRELVLNVISTVLEMNKEDRQKVGLESGALQGADSGQQQPSLSQAFIRFLETESQPKPQVLLPLAQSQISQEWGSRKTSVSSTGSLLLSTEPPQLTATALGRNPASILKDVLNDRNS